VNEEKTHISSASEGISFLGVIIWENYITIQPEKIKKFKKRIRELTPRNGGGNIQYQIQELNKYLRGWL
jgi:RNA-directed DNA polymerase